MEGGREGERGERGGGGDIGEDKRCEGDSSTQPRLQNMTL